METKDKNEELLDEVVEAERVAPVGQQKIEQIERQEKATKKPFNFGTYEIITFVGLALIIIACFLPFISALGMTATLINAAGQTGDGVFYIILAIVIAVLVYLRKHLPSLIVGGLVILFYFYHIIGISNAKKGQVGSYLKVGSGVTFLTIGVMIMAFGLIMLFINKDNQVKNN